jgi:cell fate (sporulation/competence/biofilm development) regulator YlbF (YheA/YmcA/DUF963 family)
MKAISQKQQELTKDDIAWRHFPEFEALLESEESPPLLMKVEKTCRQLNDVLQSGAEVDQARAQAAMTAYGRSLDLLRLLTEMRDKARAQK